MLRVVVVANTVGLNLYRYDNYDHPIAGMVVVAVIAAWTGFAIWACRRPRRWLPAVLAVDLVIAVGSMAATPLLKGEDFRATVPGFWVMTVVLAWAVHWRWRGGLVAAAFICATDMLIRTELTQTNYGHLFLLMIGGPIVGYMCGSLQRMAAERDAAERAAAAAVERARLARAVHDGVLQVLALVQRRGHELGGEMAELARLAGGQEAALRSLIQQQEALGEQVDPTSVDLVAAIEELGRAASPRVTVVRPGGEIRLPADRAAEIVAAVSECLSNVSRHVGEDARAWVVIEDLGAHLVLSVRDEGPGIPEGRLERAVADGRLGVAQSIRGRIDDLGGTAELSTGSFGTEWEFTLPR